LLACPSKTASAPRKLKIEQSLVSDVLADTKGASITRTFEHLNLI
jgi:hypothetical protein